MATPTSSRRYSRFQPQEVDEVQPTVSASVGHDHWANDVLKVVDKAKSCSESSASGSNSPDYSETSGTPAVVSVKAKVLEKKRKFHTGRCLELKNLPDGCVEQDIRAAFPDLGIVSVTIERNDGRFKASAKLTLDFPELLDDWPESRQNVFIRNKEVSVCVGNSDGWLCVAKLPMSYTDEEFFNLAAAYGKVREAFLMISERTGESKGYGLIKYVSSEAAAQARHLLDGRSVTDRENLHDVYKLDCDWLNSSHISFANLHSKALYVDHLPADFRDLREFKRIFSTIKPPYFSVIANVKGVIQDWGLVEFKEYVDTEETQKITHLLLFHGKRIRVHYCIPGVNAFNIYMQAVNAPPDTKKKALLQDTPTANVYSQLKKLSAQNPAFAQNLQNIIQEQIHQNLSSGTNLIPALSVSTATVVPTSTATSMSRPPSSSSSSTSNVVYSVQPPQTTMPQASTVAPSNAQAALMILLTAQSEPSVLQNPQVVSVLQNLVSNGEKPANSVELNELTTKDPSLAAVFRSPAAVAETPSSMRPALLDTPKSRPILLSNPIASINSSSASEVAAASSTSANCSSLNDLLNTQNLSQLLGSLNNSSSTDVAKAQQPPASVTSHQQTTHSQPPLIQAPQPSNMANGLYQRPVVYHDGGQSLMGFPYAAAPYYIQAAPQQQQQQQQQHLQQQFFAQPQIFSLQGFPMVTQAAAFMAAPGQSVPSMQNMNLAAFMGTSAAPGTPIVSHNQMASMLYPQPSSGYNSGYTTPSPTQHQQGLKRRLTIPPSPEQSPDGPYIGQHSQGLGGHYASSYVNKKAKY